MIDTKKYEGHTPAPWLASKELPTLTMGWAVITGDDDWILRVDEDNQGELMSEADAELIADAPLLLAEVKRLQKEHDTVRGWFLDIDNYMMEHHYDMWQEIRKEIGLDD